MRPLWQVFVLAALACRLAAPLQASADSGSGKALSFGFVPQQSASRIAEEWTPLLSEVGRRAGVPLILGTAPTIPEFEARLRRGEYDFAYMNPYHYTAIAAPAGYRAFAKEKDRRLRGLVVVRKDSPHRQLADLAGKTIALPAPAAFAASILVQMEFARLNIPVRTKFVSSHDSVYRAVTSGLYEAGGGVPRTFDASPAGIREAMRVLAETPSFSPHAFAVHPRVPRETAERVLAALASLNDDEAGRRLRAPTAFRGFAAARDEDWNDIRDFVAACGTQCPGIAGKPAGN